MATKHPRINVTLDEETAKYLALMAKSQKKTISATAKQLIESALEDAEDRYFSHLAEQRETKTKKWISAADAWK